MAIERLGHAQDSIGGDGGGEYFITNLDDSGPGSFRYGAEASDPLVIKPGPELMSSSALYVDLLERGIEVKSRKTIDLEGTRLVLRNFGFKMDGVEDVIVHNLGVTQAQGDAMKVMRSKRIIISHCELTDCGDGLLDCTNALEEERSTVSVLYTLFKDHSKGVQVGLGNREAAAENWWATFYRNYFNEIGSRSVRAEGSHVHQCNDYIKFGDRGSQSYGKARYMAEVCWYNPYGSSTQATDVTNDGVPNGYFNANSCTAYDGARIKEYGIENCLVSKEGYTLSRVPATTSNGTVVRLNAGWIDVPCPCA